MNKRAQEGGLGWGYILIIILAVIGLIVRAYALYHAGSLGQGALGGLR
ncbi:hypothetical protein KY329_05170 [Candidatus Woesearchaeota archaeon]|nr:hypothetical protein [Candidatus Woesearchaeota archaeon]